jgi:uncharacterized protein (UPF0332 family)
MSALLDRKHRALDDFVARVKESEIGDNIAKLILYGSVLRGDAHEESDIDVLVIATDDLRQVDETCSDIAFDVMLDQGQRVSPMVYCVDVLRYPISYFSYSAVKKGKEVYSMEEKQLRRAESLGYLELAIEYKQQSLRSLNVGDYRLAVDGAYNAAELCAKGLLLLKLEDIPSSHGGIIQKFGEIWIKTDLLPREMGRGLNKGFELRNQARYERHASIGEGEAKAILALAEQFIDALSAELGV